MINTASNSPLSTYSQVEKAQTSLFTSTSSGQPTLSSRQSTASSLLPPRHSLHSAAKSGNLPALLTMFIADQAAINACDLHTGLTPLQTALNGNQQRAAAMLITLGARVHDVHRLCPAENGSLHAASELGDQELLEKVLQLSSKDINAHEPLSGLTPLAFALRGKHLDVARMLLEAGANPAQANRDGTLPLVSVAYFDKADATQLLLNYGAHIDQKDKEGLTALRQAARSGKEATVKLLLASGANVHQVDDMGLTLLFDVIKARKPAILTVLLDHGLYIDHVDQFGETAFCRVAASGRVEEAQILLARGANQKHLNRLSRIPVMIAAEYGNLAFLELLLPVSKNLLDTRDAWGNTALHLAAEEGRDAAVQALIKSGADPRLTNTDGDTPLALTAKRGRIPTMALLLDAEQDLMQATENAHGILDYAVEKGTVPVLEFLLQRGIDVDDKTRTLAKDPLITEMLLYASLLKTAQVDVADDTEPEPLDGAELMSNLLNTAVTNKNADSWPTYMSNRDVSPTLSSALVSASNDARAVWKSLAGVDRKVTPAQQKNWCAGILADLGNTMRRESPYSKSGLTAASLSVLEEISARQIQSIAAGAMTGEQPLRDGVADLLQTCMKAVSDDQFYPMDLYKLLTVENGIYHNVASLIATAFADIWARRNSMGDIKLEQAFAEKLSSLKESRKTLQAMNSDMAKARNQTTVNMLMFRQLDLLQQWIEKALG